MRIENIMKALEVTIQIRIIIYYCVQDLLAQRPGAQSFLPCPDLTAASTAVVQVISNIGIATATANAQLEGVR